MLNFFNRIYLMCFLSFVFNIHALLSFFLLLICFAFVFILHVVFLVLCLFFNLLFVPFVLHAFRLCLCFLSFRFGSEPTPCQTHKYVSHTSTVTVGDPINVFLIKGIKKGNRSPAAKQSNSISYPDCFLFLLDNHGFDESSGG